MKVKMNKNTKITGSSLKGYFPEDTKYKQLVKVFGKPNCENDGYKIDDAWAGKIDDEIFTIYNYKTGHNYLGNEGKDLDQITDWHIGGNSPEIVDNLITYFNNNV